MKENNIRSFEHYQKMMDENKNKSKTINQNNSSTKILKTVNNSNSSLHKPSSKQKPQNTPSTSKKLPSKAHSPNRHKNHSHSPVKTVSYAELQLILQNIDMIKSKAKHQIEELELKNKELTNQLETLKDELERKSEVEIENERNKFTEKYQNISTDFQKRWHEVQLRERIWAEQKQQYIQEILNLKESIRLDLSTISELQQSLEKQSSQKGEWRSKYESLVSLLTAKKSQRITQLVYQMKENYNGRAILDILSEREKTILVIEKEIERVESQRNKLEQLLSEQKQHQSQTQQIINKLMAENKALLETISAKEQEYKNSLNQINQKLLNQSQINESLSEQLHSLQNEYKTRLSEIQSLKNTITSLSLKMQTQTVQNQEIASFAQQQKMNRKYFDLVDEECEQLEDISRVLAKMQVLEKCKIENRQNVEKIQFLCKMLDC